MSTPMDSLPLDLLRPIVEHLKNDVQSLLAVSLASPTLRVEGQRILFRTVVLTKGLTSHIKFLTAVTSSDRLGPLVEEYHQLGLVDAEHQEEPLWGLTCRGLQAMVNVKILLFHASNSHPSIQILHGCTFQLEIFKWESRDDAKPLTEFLLTQPHLRTLIVDWMDPELNTSTSGIRPRLQVLHGNRNAINAFLPGHRITSLKWVPDEQEMLSVNGSITHLPQEFDLIQFFSFGGRWGLPALSLVNPPFRALEVLELVGLNSVEKLQWISEIPRLRILILSKSPHSPQAWEAPLSPDSRKEYFPKLFATCKALQYIDIDTYKLVRIYQRLFRDAHPRRTIYVLEAYVFFPDWNIS